MSTERLTLVRREMAAESRSRTTSSSSSSGGKSKSKECTYNAEDGYVRMFLRGRPVTMHIPDQQRGSYSLDQKVALPNKKLKLQWVYGYRGRDCRSNLYLLPTGEIVYFNASVVVLYNTEEQQQRHYLGHNDDVKCLSVHPDMVTIATGQVAGNSKDGKCSNDSVLGAVFHPMDTNLIVTCGKSHINFWTMEGNTLSKRQGLFEEHPTCLVFSVLPGGSRISQVVSGAHEGGIFSVCVLKDGTMVSGGGKDRKVVLWDHNYRKKAEMEVGESLGPVRALAEGKPGELFVGTTKNAIIRAAFPDTLTPIVQMSCGVWTSILPWSSLLPAHRTDRFTFGTPSPTSPFGARPSMWLVLDTDTRDLVSMHTDGNEIISNVKYSPDGNFLAVASHDNFVYIYAVSENGRKYSRVGKCTVREGSSGKHVTNMDTVRNLEWFTSTCTLSFSAFGIWPDGADGTDINAVCRSHEGSLLASADDFGKVHLFSFPCSQPRVSHIHCHSLAGLAPSQEYGGHSSHVTNVAFLHDDSHLISTGGKDTSILQWIVA
ncbi:hypothetical protein GOODEAATRI_013750 [Goodea atripinnis]|uniref:Echinoderm microtubule-associated protein-like 2 n=1 Tax=Goodea atripinnis TaxID=208336 RepID=A0ABV0P493_9TELE